MVILNEVQLGAALRERRELSGLTQAAVADRAAVSRAFVIDLERGRRPRAELTRVLAVIRALDAAITLTDHQTKSAEEALDEPDPRDPVGHAVVHAQDDAGGGCRGARDDEQFPERALKRQRRGHENGGQLRQSGRPGRLR